MAASSPVRVDSSRARAYWPAGIDRAAVSHLRPNSARLARGRASSRQPEPTQAGRDKCDQPLVPLRARVSTSVGEGPCLPARDCASDIASSHSRRRRALRTCRASGARHALHPSLIGLNTISLASESGPIAHAIHTARPCDQRAAPRWRSPHLAAMPCNARRHSPAQLASERLPLIPPCGAHPWLPAPTRAAVLGSPMANVLAVLHCGPRHATG